MSLLYANDRKIKISVSIPPLYFFVDKIAGDRAEISIIVPDNKNAETYDKYLKRRFAAQRPGALHTAPRSGPP